MEFFGNSAMKVWGCLTDFLEEHANFRLAMLDIWVYRDMVDGRTPAAMTVTLHIFLYSCSMFTILTGAHDHFWELKPYGLSNPFITVQSEKVLPDLWCRHTSHPWTLTFSIHSATANAMKVHSCLPHDSWTAGESIVCGVVFDLTS